MYWHYGDWTVHYGNSYNRVRRQWLEWDLSGRRSHHKERRHCEHESNGFQGMTRSSGMLLLFLLFLLPALTGDRLFAQPLPGSQLPPAENMCAMCHGESDLWSGDQRRLHIAADDLAGDTHWTKGVVCHDCHGGDPASRQFAETHRKENGFLATAAEIREACAKCHRAEMIDVTRKSVHAKGGERNELGERTPIDCGDCHGEVQHQLLPLLDPRSPVFVDNRSKTCGACHEEELETHINSVHGPGHYRGGPIAMASCADCHGAHRVYREPDKRSMLHTNNVAKTCGTCHQGVEELLQDSVHGLHSDQEELTKGELPHQKTERQPSCTSCHQRHETALPESPEFLLPGQFSTGCGNCHSEFLGQHAQRLHGEMAEFGYVPAAKCAECHGAHDILPISDPNSRLAEANRLRTCQECHPNAVQNFSDFDPHANHKDAENYPTLHHIYAGTEAVIFGILVFFGIHTVLWLFRSAVHVLQYGGHKKLASDQHAIIRFSRKQRVFHFTMIISLMGLAVTGLAAKHSHQEWAQTVVQTIGGFQLASVWHRVFAVVMIGCCVAYLANMVLIVNRVRKSARLRQQRVLWKTLLFGPDSLVPILQDVKDLFGMIRWFFGLGPKPGFERWAYWEKFDYWAIVSIVAFIGTAGVILWMPNFFSRFLPGSSLNIAKVIHSEVSLLATASLLAIRYFNTHFRPEKFPMDLSVVTGLVSEEHLIRARPRFINRMREQGVLDSLRSTFPSKKRLWLIIIGVCFVQLIGFALLLGIMLAALEG